MNASTTKPIIDANALEAIAKERPNEKFLKGSGVLKLIQAIRDLERANRQLQAEQPTQIKDLRKVLQFYADGHHFTKSDGDAWDTVSGEPQNYWCDEAGTATVEDGSIAKLALAGHPIKFEDEDGTHAPRTKSEASREFLERMLSAMEGVIDVADRQTDEFEALRSCVVDLTLMLFKPEALRASNGQAPDDEVDLPDAEDMAHSALQEALSFGLSHDVIYRWMRAIQDQTVKAMRTPTAQAAPAAGAVAGPGWKLVPVVVTNEMWQAYKRPSGKSGDWSFAQRYTAMIAAAPTPAAQADSVLEDAAHANWVQLRSALAMLMLGWGRNPNQTMEACCRALDSATEPGTALAVLRSAPDWRDFMAAARKQGGAT